jgi:hypothetical protein
MAFEPPPNRMADDTLLAGNVPKEAFETARVENEGDFSQPPNCEQVRGVQKMRLGARITV